jgi:hypothetical protein
MPKRDEPREGNWWYNFAAGTDDEFQRINRSIYGIYYTILALLTCVPDPVTGVRPTTGDVGVRPLTATIPYAQINQRSTIAAADTVVLFLPR